VSATDVEPVEPVEPGGTMPASHVEVHGHQHPSDMQYVGIAVFLAVVTAAEVSTYFLSDLSTAALVIFLIPLMVAKFVTVCGWFMHLRYDNPLFRRVFVFGLMLAVVVFAGILLTAMEFWSSDYGR